MVVARIYEDDPTKIVIWEKDSEWRYKELIASTPTSSWRKNKFLLTLSWPTAIALKNNLGDALTMSPELTQWLNDEYMSRILPASQLRHMPSMEVGYDFLFPHQKVDVQFLSTARRALLCNDTGSGKAQPISEPVLTPSGWVTMGSLSVGDYVVGSSGKPVKVLGTFPQGVRDIYKVTMKDDSFTYADGDHLWDVKSNKDNVLGAHRILTTKDMMNYGVTRGDNPLSFKYRIPLVKPVEFEKKSLPIEPYSMGVILGDGCITDAVSITSADDEILDRVMSETKHLVDFRINSNTGSNAKALYLIRRDNVESNSVKDILTSLGLSGTKSRDKFIPQEYLLSSVGDRLNLLRGLMDSDGTIGKSKGATGGTISFCSVSLELAYGVRELVQSLGGTVSWNYHKRPKLGNYDPVVLTIKLDPEINPFFVERKASLYTPATKYHLTRFISKIEFSHRESAQCIMVDAPDRLYVTRDYIVTHNTYSGTATLRHMFENMNEDVFPLLIVAPNSTKISWAREFEKAWPGRNIHIVEGTATQRRKTFKSFSEEDGEVLIMNWEQMRHHSRLLPYGGIALKRCVECGGLDENVKITACETHDKELNMIDFNAVIGDEIHRISDPSTKMARAFKSATGKADIRIGMSGTPINATPDQLYSSLHWLYPESYPSKVKFIDRFCELRDSQWGSPTVVGIRKDRTEEFFNSIDPILRRMPKEVILPFLPPVVRIRRDVTMGAKQAKAYTQMQKKMIAELDDGTFTFTTSSLVKEMRLLQFASAYAEVSFEDIWDTDGPFPTIVGQKEKLTMSDPSCKIDAFMEDLPDYGDSSIVVFAQNKQLVNLLAARMDKAGIRYGLITGDQDNLERQAYMDDFQAGHLKYILVSIQAGGTGITLTRADTMVFLQRSYDMIGNVQAEGRALRIGSEIHDQINIVDYVTTGSSDELVLDAIERKLENLEFVLRDKEAIRSFLLGKLPFFE